MQGEKEHIEQSFGLAIKELRQSKDLSQAKLAELGNFNRTFISDLERGVYQPTLFSIFRLAKALEVAPHIIIQRVEEFIEK